MGDFALRDKSLILQRPRVVWQNHHAAAELS